jgi:hypothetical protein
VGDYQGYCARNNSGSALEFGYRLEPLFNALSVNGGVEEMAGPWISGFRHGSIAQQWDDREIPFPSDR